MTVHIVFANRAFVTYLDGARMAVREGDPFASDHPLVVKFPAWFDRDSRSVRWGPSGPPVEQATADPSDRQVRRRG